MGTLTKLALGTLPVLSHLLWIDRAAIADALGLTHDQQVLLAQTVGYPKQLG